MVYLNRLFGPEDVTRWLAHNVWRPVQAKLRSDQVLPGGGVADESRKVGAAVRYGSMEGITGLHGVSSYASLVSVEGVDGSSFEVRKAYFLQGASDVGEW